MRKTTEELWNEAVDVTPWSDDVHEAIAAIDKVMKEGK